ncbi:MAG: glycosyltransferase [Ignavibacteriales bacterium]|nr:glycosyltransferase [Ignavibacteriales bacterium]
MKTKVAKESKTKLAILIILGIISSFYFFSWWFQENRFLNPLFMILFILAFLYTCTQVYSVWYIILHAKFPSFKEYVGNYTVDVFVPTFKEPIWLIEKAVSAAVGIEYPHKTYLIDDGNNPEHKQIAAKFGAIYITRQNNLHNKAGNINNALNESSGELVAIFDIDHVPATNYLSRSVGRFNNPKIGAVQILLDHYNSEDGFVAAACSELNDDFFGPSTLGMNGCGCTTVFGSNAIFRRKALQSINGYIPGLAEDLNTSITLHSAGWETDYVPEVLAKGLVPTDVTSFFKQQLKWSRGVFDTLLNVYPKLARKLEFNKQVCYLTRMTYYTAGPVVGLHILATLVALLGISELATSYFSNYLFHSIPFLFFFIYIHQFAGKNYTIKPATKGFRLRGIILVFGTWPIYTISFLYALFGIRIPFMETPKIQRKRRFFKLIMPQIVVVILLIALAAFNFLTEDRISSTLIINIFALGLAFVHLGLFYAVWEDWKRNKSIIQIPELVPQLSYNNPGKRSFKTFSKKQVL